MNRTRWLQETRMIRFEEAYFGWSENRLTQEQDARLLGVHEKTFRRYINRCHEDGMEGLLDKRLVQVSHLWAPVDEVIKVESLYCDRYRGWSVKHFYGFYRRVHAGGRSYSWVKDKLQRAGLVEKAKSKGKHHKRWPPAPMVGMMRHQDGSTHQWVEGLFAIKTGTTSIKRAPFPGALLLTRLPPSTSSDFHVFLCHVWLLYLKRFFTSLVVRPDLSRKKTAFGSTADPVSEPMALYIKWISLVIKGDPRTKYLEN